MDIKELRNLPPAELDAELKKLSGEYESMLMKARLNQHKQVHQISALRKTIARIKMLQAQAK